MEIHVDGNRSSSENWMQARTVPPQELPQLSAEQRAVAAKFGMKESDYARQLLAINLGRKDLEKKAERAERAARLIERLASEKVRDVSVKAVWLKTFDGKYRFELESKGRQSLLFVTEDVVDDVLESGSEFAEQQICKGS